MSNSIYIRVPAGYGDSLMATAVIAAVKRQMPRLRVFIVTRKTDIYLHNPNITACYNTRIVLKRNRSIYERCCVFEYDRYDRLRELCSRKHYIDYFYDCLPFKIEERMYKPQIYLSKKERDYKRRSMLDLHRPMVAISPYGGQSTRIPNKFYPVEKWPDIIEGLRDAGVTVLQFGRKKEGGHLPGTVDFRNIGYRRSAAVLAHCDAMVTHPSGFMHLATALDVPSVTLFGGVEDPLVGGYEVNFNMTVDLPCAPCWLPRPCESPVCREELSPEKIVNKILEVVKEG